MQYQIKYFLFEVLLISSVDLCWVLSYEAQTQRKVDHNLEESGVRKHIIFSQKRSTLYSENGVGVFIPLTLRYMVPEIFE